MAEHPRLQGSEMRHSSAQLQPPPKSSPLSVTNRKHREIHHGIEEYFGSMLASVLPPPSRHPNQSVYGTGYATSNGNAPVIETSNSLKHPTGPEYQFLVGEGLYVLRDDLHLATPPPHPSEAPVTNPNPLATSLPPPSTGTKLSIISLAPKRARPLLYKYNTGSSARASTLATQREDPREDRSSTDLGGLKSSTPASIRTGAGRASSDVQENGTAPAFGEGNSSLLATPTKDALKRRKPKSNMMKSNSSFVSRMIPHEAMTKRLQERGFEDVFAFANVNRAYQWLDLSSAQKSEQLAKVLFTKAHALCHDVNPLTANAGHLDVLMGFSSGDVIWYEPMSQKYARLNKNGVINAFAISEIRWIPGSENLFLAAHTDGSLVVYDKEKEDAAFSPEDREDPFSTPPEDGDQTATLRISKSVNSKNQKTNPVACWKLSNQRINAFAFSPDNQHLAVVSEDGSMRIIDYLKERLLDIFHSYYGGFNCVCWSPDGKYIVAGGQDDLVSIWSLAEGALVARCQGHQSWVSAVAFDPWRCDERNYRIGSVGDDCRLLLWDFNVGMLTRPKPTSRRSVGGPRRRESQATTTTTTAARYRSNSNVTAASLNSRELGSVITHPVESRSETAILPPVMSKSIDEHPLCWLGFEEDCIITSCNDGHIRTWDRPKDGTSDV